MKRPLMSLLLCTIVALACMNADASPPRPRLTVSGGGAVAPDSTVKLSTKVYVRNFAQGDTLRYDWYKDNVALSPTRSVNSRDSVMAVAPAYGASSVYKGCAQIERGGRLSPLKYPVTPVCWTWTYARPALPIPDPVIDSVKQIVLRPPLASVLVTLAGAVPQPANQVQFCAFAVLKSGARVKTQNSWNSEVCERAYQSWLAEVPA